MKRTFALCCALVLATGFLFVGCGKQEPASLPRVDEGEQGAVGAGAGGAPVEGAQITQEMCSVMGNPINKNIFVDHDGRRVYFCCKMCVNTFKEDPEKYISKLDG